MDLMKYPKWVKGKYDWTKKKYLNKVRGQAYKRVEADVRKKNKTLNDFSDMQIEAMVADMENKIKQRHKDKSKNFVMYITGLNLVKSLWKKGPWGIIDSDDDDEKFDV